MPKNRTIAIAISSALLALSQVDAAPAATPLAGVRVVSKSAKPLNATDATGDYDRAFVAQRTGDALNEELRTGNFLAPPVWIHRLLDPDTSNRGRSPGRPIPTVGPMEVR